MGTLLMDTSLAGNLADNLARKPRYVVEGDVVDRAAVGLLAHSRARRDTLLLRSVGSTQ